MKQIQQGRFFRRGRHMRFLALATAFVYLSGLIITSVVHPLLHQQHEVTYHTVAEEKDACHRAIYHGENEHSSDHHTHISGLDTQCALCDVITTTDQLLSHQIISTVFSYNEHAAVFFKSAPAFGYHSFSPTRGPPSIG